MTQGAHNSTLPHDVFDSPRLHPAGAARLGKLGAPALRKIAEAVKRTVHGQASALDPAALMPPHVLTREEQFSDFGLAARAQGDALLKQGNVALLMVAGGMGTRLGWAGPKGTFPLGPVSDRSLFEYFAQQIKAVQRRCGATLPWLIQTSQYNHLATEKFFEEHGWFGLGAESVRLFCQNDLPAFDAQGKLVVDRSGHPVMLPDGHGGVFSAVVASGGLDWLRGRGASVVSYLQVDNPLGLVADPYFLGAHMLSGSEMSTKVVLKERADERVGLLVQGPQGAMVVEYSELSAEVSAERNPDGSLRLRAANTAMHALDIAFMERMAKEDALPIHVARKPVPNPVNSSSGEQPGLKLEYFVFDALQYAKNPLAVEVGRAEQFAPVKECGGTDTPENARESLSRITRALVVATGLPFPDGQELLEHDPSLIAEPSEARALIPVGSRGFLLVPRDPE